MASGKDAKSPLWESFYNSEQKALQQSLVQLIDKEINPHCDQWEADKIFPAHQVFKKLGDVST